MTENSALASALIHPQAWIGNMVGNIAQEANTYHFSAGLGISTATVPKELFDWAKGGDPYSLSIALFPVVRIGGFILPFDFAIGAMYLPFKYDDLDACLINGIFEFCYRIICDGIGLQLIDSSDTSLSVNDNPFIPALSLGLGFGFTNFEIKSFLSNEPFDNSSGTSVVADVSLTRKLETYTFYFSIHLSKDIRLWDSYSEGKNFRAYFLDNPFVYWIPYLGFKLAVGISSILGHESLTQVLAGAVPLSNYDVSKKLDDGIRLCPIFYGGLGSKFFGVVLLNIGLSYDVANGIIGAQLSLGASL